MRLGTVDRIIIAREGLLEHLQMKSQSFAAGLTMRSYFALCPIDFHRPPSAPSGLSSESHFVPTARCCCCLSCPEERHDRRRSSIMLVAGGHKKHRHCRCFSLSPRPLRSVCDHRRRPRQVTAPQPDYLLSVYDHIVRLNGRLFVHRSTTRLLVIASFKSTE